MKKEEKHLSVKEESKRYRKNLVSESIRIAKEMRKNFEKEMFSLNYDEFIKQRREVELAEHHARVMQQSIRKDVVGSEWSLPLT